MPARGWPRHNHNQAREAGPRRAMGLPREAEAEALRPAGESQGLRHQVRVAVPQPHRVRQVLRQLRRVAEVSDSARHPMVAVPQLHLLVYQGSSGCQCSQRLCSQPWSPPPGSMGRYSVGSDSLASRISPSLPNHYPG